MMKFSSSLHPPAKVVWVHEVVVLRRTVLLRRREAQWNGQIRREMAGQRSLEGFVLHLLHPRVLVRIGGRVLSQSGVLAEDGHPS